MTLKSSLPNHEIKNLSCPSCTIGTRVQSTRPYPLKNPVPKGVREPQTIQICSDCGLGVASPLFNEKEESIIYQQGEYWKPVRSKINIRRLALPYALAQNRWKFVRPYLPQSKEISILDIGSGQGAFGLVAAHDPHISLASYDTVEPDPRMINDLKSLWDQNQFKPTLTQYTSIEDIKASNKKYDLIVFSHVIEHVRDPISVLKSLKKHLTNDGRILIEIPHQDFLFKEDVFPHVLFFNKRALRTLISRAGYKINDVDIFGHDMKKNVLGKYASVLLKRTVDTMRKGSQFLPLGLSRHIFDWAFGGHKKSAQGIWLRAVASPQIDSNTAT